MIRLVFIACLVMPLLTYAQGENPADTLTIEEAIQAALEKNYSIRIARKNQEVNTNNFRYGKYVFFPTLEASVTRNSTYNLSFEQTLRQTDDTSRSPGGSRNFAGTTNINFNASADLNWTIFDGFGMFVNYKQLAELQKAGMENAQISVENTVAQVNNAYYNIIQLQEKVSAFEDALKISEQRLELAKAQYEVGAGSKLNYLAAQVDYNTDKSSLILQSQQLKNAKISLNQLLSRDASVPFIVSDTILIDSTLALESLRETVARSNPSLLLAQRNKNIVYLDTRAIQAQRFPRVSLFAGYGYTNQNNGAGFFRAQTSETINYGITATVPIFNGFDINRRLQNAKIQREITENQLQDLQVQINADLERAYTDYQNSIQLIKLEQANLEVARQNVDIALERYRLGVSTPLELREVQRNAVNTETRLIEAEYAAKLAEIELLRLSSEIVQ